MIIAPSCSSPHPLLQVHQNTSTTDAKIRKISFAIFGAMALIAGYFLCTIGAPIPTLLAIPLFIAGGVLLWQVTKIRDYEDPATLKSYQEAAKTMTLSEIEYMHTRANMSKYEIPLKSDFPRIYRESMKGKRFVEIMDTYKAYKGLKFSVPPPKEFKAVFERETTSMNACIVFAKYNIEKLHEYGIVIKRFYDDHTSFINFCKSHEKARVCAQTTYDRKVKEALSTFRPVLDQACGDNPSRQAWIEQLKREGAHLAGVPPHRWPRGTLNIMTPPTIPEGDTVAESMSALFEAHKVFIAQVTAAKEIYDDQAKILRDTMASKKLGINQRHEKGFTAP